MQYEPTKRRYMYLVTDGKRGAFYTSVSAAIYIAKRGNNRTVHALTMDAYKECSSWDVPTFKLLSMEIWPDVPEGAKFKV